ncbi:MAG: TIGR03905 family TSCPD domain-containing protein [Clostridia bacterium]|nr:TIGR03905 family TSCPD domain-containing protein [Clostridia bacterium]
MNTYKTRFTCATQIQFEVEDDIITFVKFNGGCRGNTQAVAKLVQGRNIDEVIDTLKGIECRMGTSCADQLANALIEYKQKNA